MDYVSDLDENEHENENDSISNEMEEEIEIDDNKTTTKDIGISTEPLKRPCNFFYERGWCKFGQNCKFSHAFRRENLEN